VTDKGKTRLAVGILIGLALAWEFYAIAFLRDATISEITWEAFARHTTLAIAFGILVGHLAWQASDKYRFYEGGVMGAAPVVAIVTASSGASSGIRQPTGKLGFFGHIKAWLTSKATWIGIFTGALGLAVKYQAIGCPLLPTGAFSCEKLGTVLALAGAAAAGVGMPDPTRNPQASDNHIVLTK